jgi:hypothetical protein
LLLTLLVCVGQGTFSCPTYTYTGTWVEGMREGVGTMK